jgi:phospholipase C
MAGIDRRQFMTRAAVTAAAAAGGVALARGAQAAPPMEGGSPGLRRPTDPGCDGPEPDWTVPPSTLPSNPGDCPISNIGVLMMENRTYDTYLGWLENGRGFLNLGLELEWTKPDGSLTARPEHWAPVYRRCGHPDPGHSWDAGRDQLRNGFLAGRNDEYALAYYLAEDIPVYARIARQFTVFDRYFCSNLAGTYPNRHYQHGADAGGFKTNVFPPETDQPIGFTWPTIWDRLDEAGLSGAYYFSDLPFIAMYGTKHLSKMRPITQFYVDAALGQLPDVYFVDPGFLPPFQTDDHPGSADINAGQAFVNNVTHAIVKGPQWPSTAFFINYDEWGGFFDHVTPPRVPDDRASDDLDEDWAQLGFRVPALAISPYSRKGHVHHDGPYEHTSILRFIEWRWDLQALTTRDANAKNIGEAFDFDQEPRLQIGIQQVQTPTIYESASPECQGPEEVSDFVRLAESQFLRDLGVEVASLSPAEMLGNAGPVLQTTNGAVDPAEATLGIGG